MAGGTEPTEAQAVVRETLNYASGEGGEAGCWLWYHPLLLYLHFFLLTDRWGASDEVSQGVCFSGSGLEKLQWGSPVFPVFCTISLNWKQCLSYSTGEGAGREGPVSSDKDVCWGDAPMTHLCLWIGQRVVLERVALILKDETISCQTYNEQWGHGVIASLALCLHGKSIPY